MERSLTLLQPVLDIPYIRKTRRNHGLEHATIHLLSQRVPGLRIVGRSDSGGFWLWGAISLIRQEKQGTLRTWRDLSGIPSDERVVSRVFLRGIRQYLARDFHPSHNANERIAHDWMTARGMSLPGSKSEAA